MGGSDDHGSGSSDDGYGSGSQSTRHSFTSPGLKFANRLHAHDDSDDDEIKSSIDSSGMALVPTPSPRHASGKAVQEPLHVPASVWDCDMVEKGEVDGKRFWRCLHCKHVFKGPFNATKAKAHLAKIHGEDIKPCDKPHPSHYADMYSRQWEEMKGKKIEQKRRAEYEKKSVEARTQAGVEDLIAQGTSRAAKRLRKEGLTNQPQTFPSPKTPNTTSTQESVENFLPGNIDRANLLMDGMITEFIVMGGQAFNTAEDPLFLNILQGARYIGKSYKPPTRKLITGALLESLYKRKYNSMIKQLVREADKYGIALYGDGATIAKTPFFNILGSGVHLSNACLEIHDCTERMVSGGRKDAAYIAKICEEHIDTISKEKKEPLVDLVIFDGASNVQKAGSLLEEKYPIITCIHGGEHVVSLFFLILPRHQWDHFMSGSTNICTSGLVEDIMRATLSSCRQAKE